MFNEFDWVPQPQNKREIEVLAECFAVVVEGRTAFYVSSPLTTGLRAFEWHTPRSSGDAVRAGPTSDDKFRRDVIEPNRAAAATYVRRLREKTKSAVIDPTAMGDVSGWIQADYHFFWGEVIKRYAHTVVFRDGWMYSTGCAYEFLVASVSGAQTLREDLTPLTGEQGRELIQQAVLRVQSRPDNVQLLRRIVDALMDSSRIVGQ